MNNISRYSKSHGAMGHGANGHTRTKQLKQSVPDPINGLNKSAIRWVSSNSAEKINHLKPVLLR